MSRSAVRVRSSARLIAPSTHIIADLSNDSPGASGVLLRDSRLERRGLLFVDREGTPGNDKTRHLAGCGGPLLSKEKSLSAVLTTLNKSILKNRWMWV